MVPTLQIGDHLLVSKFYYGLKVPFTGTTLIPWNSPKHGDVIVFKYPKDRSIDYIKRVIGVPGDTIRIKNKKIFINEKPIVDPHAHFMTKTILKGSVSPRDNFGPITVPDDKIFAMGDNRDNSRDSRIFGFVDGLETDQSPLSTLDHSQPNEEEPKQEKCRNGMSVFGDFGLFGKGEGVSI